MQAKKAAPKVAAVKAAPKPAGKPAAKPSGPPQAKVVNGKVRLLDVTSPIPLEICTRYLACSALLSFRLAKTEVGPLLCVRSLQLQGYFSEEQMQALKYARATVPSNAPNYWQTVGRVF